MKKLLIAVFVCAAASVRADRLAWTFEASATNRVAAASGSLAAGVTVASAASPVVLVTETSLAELDARPWFARMCMGFFDFEPLGAVLIVR